MSGFVIDNDTYRIAVFYEHRMVFALYETIDDTLECDTEWNTLELKWPYIADQEIHGAECEPWQGLESIAIFISGVLL
jgi:hypothetical protein